MAKICTTFPNCASLADKFGIKVQYLYSYIRTYNDYARRNNQSEDIIKPDVKYSDEQLLSIFNRISSYRTRRRRDPKFDREERKSLIKTMGSPSAYALSIIQSSRLTGEEINDIRQEIVQSFISYMDSWINITESNTGIRYDAEELIRNNSLEAIFNGTEDEDGEHVDGIRDFFLEAYDDALQAVNNGTATAHDKGVVDLCEKFLIGQGLDDIFTELCIFAIPMINQIYDIHLNDDLTVGGNYGNNNELALQIRDKESTLESWQQSLDTRPAEGSVSSIVRRIAMHLPRIERKVIEHYYDKDDKEVDLTSLQQEMSEDEFAKYVKDNISRTWVEYKDEIVYGKIFNRPLYSDPSFVIRRLFGILEDVTDENEMIDKLSQIDLFNMSFDGGPSLVEYLKSHPRERTTFFADFNKYFQNMYAVTMTQNGDGTYDMSAPSLNGSKSDLLREYFGGLLFGKLSDNSVFTNNGISSRGNALNLDSKSFIKFKESFKRMYNVTGNQTQSQLDTLFENGKYDDIASFLIMHFDALAIKHDFTIINEVAHNQVLTEKICKALNDIYAYVSYKLKGDVVKLLENNKTFTDSIGDILSIISVSDTKSNASIAMVDYAGSKISQRILPSAITNFTKKLHSYTGSQFEKWIENQYTNGDQFKSGNVILNRWLKDFLEANKEDTGSSQSNRRKAKYGNVKDFFNISRNLGIGGTKFEEISDRSHMLSFIFQYLGHRDFNVKYIPVTSNGNNLVAYNSATGQYDDVVKLNEKDRYVMMDTIKSYRVDGRGEGFIEEYRHDVAMIPLFITGDTNALRLFSTMHYYEPEILEGMYNFYISDLATQNVIKSLDEHGIVISANAKETMTKAGNENKFGILDFLNDKKWRDKINIDKNGVVTKEAFIKVAKEYLDLEFDTFYERLNKMGILDKVETESNGQTKNKYVYFDSFLKDIGYDSATEEEQDNAVEEKLKEFFFDYKFGLYNQIHLIHVTPLAFSGVEDLQKRNKVYATNGTALSQKAEINGVRLFSDNNFSQNVVYFKDVFAPMNSETETSLRNFVIDQYKNSVGIKRATEPADEMVSKFRRNSLTDGEAYRIFDSYRAVLASAGKNFWSSKHEEAYNRINEIRKSIKGEKRNATVQEIQEIEDLMVAMQPIKPINDGIETYKIGKSNVKIGFQFKYAEVPLIPELYPIGSKLRQMGEWMEQNDVHLAASDKCLKKGSFGEIDLQFKTKDGRYIDKNGNFIPGKRSNGKIIEDGNVTMAEQRRYCQDITNNWKNPEKDPRIVYDDDITFDEIINNQTSTITRTELDENGNEYQVVLGGWVKHSIPLDNYLIQNNVPDHSDGKVIVGTQIRKIVGSAIKFDRTYSVKVGNKTLQIKGDKLFRMYNALHTAKYMKSYLKFDSLMQDEQKLISMMSYNILSNGRSNLALIERIGLTYDGLPIVPYSEVSNGSDLMSSVISIFKKNVIRQEIAGGNIVQASSLGVGTKWVKDGTLKATRVGDVITGMEAEAPFMFSIQSADGNSIPLKYEEYCNDDGTCKMTEDGSQTLIESRFPGILDLEMYRIPTEGLYSIYHVHVARCCPKTSANTLKLPAECTTISDFDFDIDKLMFMKRTYTVSDDEVKIEDDVTDSRIWEAVYRENPVEIYAALKIAQANATDAQKAELAQELSEKRGKTITPDKLHLNHYWPLANISTPKQEVFDMYAKDYYEYKPGKLVESRYDFDEEGGGLIDLQTAEIDNAIIDITESVMSDESTVIERFTPGGFDMMKDDARVLRVLIHKSLIPEIADKQIKSEQDLNDLIQYIRNNDKLDYKDPHDYSSPMTSIIFKQFNQVAGQEIGIFANDNVNDAISRRLKTLMIADPNNALLFGSLINQTATVTKDGAVTKGFNNLIGRDFLFDVVNGRSVSKSLHELLGSSVDAVKDNALIDINLNEVTGDLGAMLVRLGYSTFDVGLLFNQPIVKKMCQEIALSGEDSVTKVLKKVVLEYTNDKNALMQPVNNRYVTTYNLVNNLMSNNDDRETAINVARLLNKMFTIKQELSDYVQQTRNTSANTVKVDIGKYIANKQKVDNRDKKQFKLIKIVSNDNLNYPITKEWQEEHWSTLGNKTLREKLKAFMDKYNDHPYQYENAVSNIIDASMELMINRFTPYNSPDYIAYREFLEQYMAPWGLSGEHINQLHAFIPALMVKDLPGDFNPNGFNNPMGSRGVSNKEYYLTYIIDILQGAIEEGLDEYGDLCKNLVATTIGPQGNDFMILNFKSPKNYNQTELFGITMQWDDMMKAGGKIAEFAKALYLHEYYLNGLIPQNNRIMSLAPPSVLEKLVADETTGASYLDIYDEQYNDKKSIDVISAQTIEYMICHANDEKIVPKMPFRIKDVTTSEKLNNGKNAIYLNQDKIWHVKMSNIDNSNMLVRPIINIDGVIYVLQRNNATDQYSIGTPVNNIVPKSTQQLTYVKLAADQSPDFREYSIFYNKNNGYLYNNYESKYITDDVVKEEESNTYAEEDERELTDGQQAALEASKEPERADDNGQLSC